LEKSEGKCPDITLDLRLKVCSAERRLIVSGGIAPRNPTPGNLIAITLDLSSLQVTPVQEAHMGELSFQFRGLEGGNLFTKSSNASLSSTGSPLPCHRTKHKREMEEKMCRNSISN